MAIDRSPRQASTRKLKRSETTFIIYKTCCNKTRHIDVQKPRAGAFVFIFTSLEHEDARTLIKPRVTRLC